jgi:hypothetical protein
MTSIPVIVLLCMRNIHYPILECNPVSQPMKTSRFVKYTIACNQEDTLVCCLHGYDTDSTNEKTEQVGYIQYVLQYNKTHRHL